MLLHPQGIYLFIVSTINILPRSNTGTALYELHEALTQFLTYLRDAALIVHHLPHQMKTDTGSFFTV